MLFLEHFLEEVLPHYFDDLFALVVGDGFTIILSIHPLQPDILHKLNQALGTNFTLKLKLPQLKARIVCFGEDDFEEYALFLMVLGEKFF